MSQKDQLHNNNKTTSEHRLPVSGFDNSSNTFQQAHPAVIIQRAMSAPGSLSPATSALNWQSGGSRALDGGNPGNSIWSYPDEGC
ncbi:hypothetical protein L9W92_04710 [Pelotomaculum terephthalicicum JT]|uniref:hypothetical protein n=1 Tax=Pelotomaculum TaxID=191373 RepID=UPI0009D25A00|nr:MULTISPECIES: hypothetical protein [Pelotomaculum]MCG9967357.1 hypothetical protein [Pelotomaculum terephthalicicum JT]OPX85889.1 MAG: hypothetical protein A4E54_02181 [Pelotomaculum sp. PtaB.Bin117]OPY60980.1 MAG: hypothetical protein A4E56_02358 [Pelotomaculum sp. PtaU1.Bin065]